MFIFEFTNRYILTENEWINKINKYINKLETIKTGQKMIELFNYYIDNGYQIIISNYNKNKINQYPHIIKKSNTKIILYLPENYNCKVETKKNNIVKFKKQKQYMIFYHELVHILRYIYNCNDINEEEDTIYGLDNVLVVDDITITENAIRNEFGLSLRISHNSIDL